MSQVLFKLEYGPQLARGHALTDEWTCVFKDAPEAMAGGGEVLEIGHHPEEWIALRGVAMLSDSVGQRMGGE